MLRDMLGTPKIRPSAMQLWEKSKLVLLQAENEATTPHTPQSIPRTISTSPSQKTPPRTPPEQPAARWPGHISPIALHQRSSTMPTPARPLETGGTAHDVHNRLSELSSDRLDERGTGSPSITTNSLTWQPSLDRPMNYGHHSRQDQIPAQPSFPRSQTLGSSNNYESYGAYSSNRISQHYPTDTSLWHHQQNNSYVDEPGTSSNTSFRKLLTLRGRHTGSPQGRHMNNHKHESFTSTAAQVHGAPSTFPTESPTQHLPLPSHKTVQSTPYLSVDQLHRWKQERKERGSDQVLPDSACLNEISQRDHVSEPLEMFRQV